eukprot:gene3362-52166_t
MLRPGADPVPTHKVPTALMVEAQQRGHDTAVTKWKIRKGVEDWRPPPTPGPVEQQHVAALAWRGWTRRREVDALPHPRRTLLPGDGCGDAHAAVTHLGLSRCVVDGKEALRALRAARWNESQCRPDVHPIAVDLRPAGCGEMEAEGSDSGSDDVLPPLSPHKPPPRGEIADGR